MTETCGRLLQVREITGTRTAELIGGPFLFPGVSYDFVRLLLRIDEIDADVLRDVKQSSKAIAGLRTARRCPIAQRNRAHINHRTLLDTGPEERSLLVPNPDPESSGLANFTFAVRAHCHSG